MSAEVTSGGRAPEPGADPAPVALPAGGPVERADRHGAADLRGARGRSAWWHPRAWLPLVVALAVVAVAWTLVARSSPFVLPPLADLARALVADPGAYLANAASTLGVAGAGLAIGVAGATAAAVAVSEVPVLRRALMPLATVLNVTPVVALAPGLGVALGFGPLPKVVVAAIIVFFPVLVNTATGLRSVDRGALQVLSTLDASRAEVLRRLRVPSAAPYVFAALRVVVPLSLVGAVVAEFSVAGSSVGLGWVISQTANGAQLPEMYAAVVWLAVMGVTLFALVTVAERRALHWHDSQRAGR